MVRKLLYLCVSSVALSACQPGLTESAPVMAGQAAPITAQERNKGRRPIRICLLNSAEPIQGRRLAIRKASGGKSPCNRVCPLPRARSTSRCSIAPSTTRSRYPADISISPGNRLEERWLGKEVVSRVNYRLGANNYKKNNL